MKVIVALDGEVLVSTTNKLEMAGQREAIAQIAAQIATLIEEGHDIVVTHGNAPQVGSVLFRSEVASHAIHSLPLDVCGADTQGATGYMLQQALQNELDSRNIDRDAATVVTQVLVDPAKSSQVKGIGPFFDRNRANAYENSRGWEFILIAGHGYQRAVPSLLPQRIFEGNVIRSLVQGGAVVVCAGGGGIPVRLNEDGRRVGVEAVVDKAHTALLLAKEVQADTIIFVTHMEKLERAFRLSLRYELATLSLSDVEDILDAETPESSTSVYPELIAARNFVREHETRRVFLTPPERLADVISGCCGIAIVP
ncbi:MAG: carbamate kinase [Chloroflexota bacterium]